MYLPNGTCRSSLSRLFINISCNKIISYVHFFLFLKRIFVQCIHVQIMDNVFRKEIVDVVFAHRHTTVMIVEKVQKRKMLYQ